MDKKFLQIFTIATLSTLFTGGNVIADLDEACLARCEENYEHCKNNMPPHYTPNQRESHLEECDRKGIACGRTCMFYLPHEPLPPPYRW